MTVKVGIRSIPSGAASIDGHHVVLNAKADDGEADIALPAEEIPRLIVLLAQLLGSARAARSKEGASTYPVFDVKSLELEQRPHEGRDILRVVLGQTRDEALFLALKPGQIAEICEGILHALGRTSPPREGSAH